MDVEMMPGILTMKKSYEEAILNENWEAMKKYYTEENCICLLFHLTVARDTVFHMAVYSKTKQPLQHLMQIAEDDPLTETAYEKKNAFGNAPLHLAAMVGNFEAVQLLVNKNRNLLEITNDLGETPLFKAASYGKTKIVKFLVLQQPGQMTPEKRLKMIHRQRKSFYGDPGASILHVTIQGEHFGTALELLGLDSSLAAEEDETGRSSLQLLAHIPSAFRSGYPMALWKKFLYICLPVFEDNNDEVESITDNNLITNEIHGSSGDRESGYGNNDHRKGSHGTIRTLSKTIHLYSWRILFDEKSIERPKMGKIWKQKRKHKFALELAKLLIMSDYAWKQTITEDSSSYFRAIGEQGGDHHDKDPKPEDINSQSNKEVSSQVQGGEGKPLRSSGEQGGKNHHLYHDENALLVATRKGIVEIVEEILLVHPYAVEHYSNKQQNILHTAILNRRKEIFDFVKKMRIPMARLVGGIDKNGYTILHCAADMEYYTGGTRLGPAYQLQDELKWFRRVEKLVPPHFIMHHDKKSNKTAKLLFNEQHEKQLKEAQKWIKETSQSCSAVAVLVSTVVFAAAYTVPGGSNERGLPNFLDSPLFLFFTVMDVVSLAGSLTAVVMFLSILSSPFDYEDFRKSLPRKLTFGFTLLFLSVATTMLAFTATILLVIRLEPRRWTSTLVYTAAFLPVSILALTQFPLYVAFVETFMNTYKAIRKIFPLNLARRLFPIHRLFRQQKSDFHST